MVGPKRAEALIAARPFRSWEEVAKVEGMALGMIDDLRSGGAELGYWGTGWASVGTELLGPESHLTGSRAGQAL